MFKIKVEIIKMLGKSKTKKDPKFKKLKAMMYTEDDVLKIDIGLIFEMFAEVMEDEWNKKYPKNKIIWDRCFKKVKDRISKKK